MNPNQPTVESLMKQAQQAQQSLNQIYQQKGLKFDAATGKAVPLAGFKAPKINTNISATEIGNVQPFILPEQTPSTTAQNNLGALTAGSMQEYSQPEPSQQDQLKASIAELIKKQSSKADVTESVYNQEGVAQKEQLARDLTTKYEKTQKEYEKRIEERRKNTTGSFGGAMDADIAKIQRERDSHLADIAIDQKKAVGDYESAFNIAKAKIDAEFEPLQDQINSYMSLINLLQDDMTESEKFQATQIANEKQAQLDFERQKELMRYKAAIDAAAGGGAGTISPYQDERQFRTIQSVDELGILARATPGIFGRTAALPLPSFLRTQAFRDFSAQLETLKANIAFGELTAMREASKTGGALGQVSDREASLLQAALGALNMSQSPKSFNAQLQKIKDSILRWRAAGGQPLSGGNLPTVTAPNGEQVIIID